jgi:hypothetical protein
MNEDAMTALLSQEAPPGRFNHFDNLFGGEWHSLVCGSCKFGFADWGDLDERVCDADAG